MRWLLPAPVVLALALLASPAAAAAAERTIILAVKNMDCAACPTIVKGSLKAIPGVTGVTVSFKDKTATVSYDDSRATVKQLTSATASAGYPSAPRS